MTPNQKAFLDMIAHSEGTTRYGDQNGYNVIVGGSLFDSYVDHPRKLVQLSPTLRSTAAGRYQLLARYFDTYKAQLHLPDFSPYSQDTIALQQIRECHAIDDIEAGRFDEAVAKCAHIWASLPGAGYGQHENQLDKLRLSYHEAGGAFSQKESTMDWIKQIAPTIASALGGPLAGLAVEAVSKAIGVSQDDVKSLLGSAKLTADQVAQIKVADLELQKQAQTLGLDFEKLAVDDRKSARDMQSATRSWIPGTLAVFVTLGFFGILLALMYGQVQKTDEVMIMLGSLGTAWTGIIAFYFGSSASSQHKDVLLANSVPAK
ncbi:MAG: glycoside hydrolase family 104 protein [Betaproteobacteria bacterium]|nr:glycoside hydrolase family 104 protein [Betaproteobacteria bacterium]